jgi:protein-histidine N-methyltransferase
MVYASFLSSSILLSDFSPDTSPLAVPHLDPDSPPRDPAEPGDVELTPALRSAFAASLASRGITLRFFAGGWRSFASSLAGPYALVLSSETIYEVAALPALVPLLRVASPKQDGALEDAVAGLDISGGGGGGGRGTCLVAAKVLYFGVGGGVPDFVRAVEGAGGRVDTVWERSEGVGRRIMRVSWS